jgi:hypothetical protein
MSQLSGPLRVAVTNQNQGAQAGSSPSALSPKAQISKATSHLCPPRAALLGHRGRAGPQYGEDH